MEGVGRGRVDEVVDEVDEVDEVEEWLGDKRLKPEKVWVVTMVVAGV